MKKNNLIKRLLYAVVVLLFLQGNCYSQHNPPLVDSTKIRHCGFHAGFLESINSNSVALKTMQTSAPASAVMNCGRFRLTFQDVSLGVGYGFDAPGGQGALYQQCACDVANYIQTVFQIPAGDGTPIDIVFNQSWNFANTTGLPDPSILAVGGPLNSNPAFTGGTAGFYGGNVYEHYTTGSDAYPAAIDGVIQVNFQHPYRDCSMPRTCGLFDLYSVLLHEFTHTMGWYSEVQQSPIQSIHFPNQQFSKYDEFFLYWGDVTTAPPLIKIVNNTGPSISGGLPANALTASQLWVNGNKQNDPVANQNFPAFANLSYAAPGAGPPGTSSHLGDYQQAFEELSVNAPGFIQNYVMAPSFYPNQVKNIFTDQELRSLNTMGYMYDPVFIGGNGYLTVNRQPYTTKVVYDNAWTFSGPYEMAEIDLPANVPPDRNITNCSTAVFNLTTGADPTLNDPDGDVIRIFPGSLYNIRGCGSGGNNSNGLAVVNLPGGDQITYTPRPDFLGRAQFGFHLWDGKEKGDFMVYTIDVTGCNACPNNLVVAKDFEEGMEIKTLLHPTPDNAGVQYYRDQKYEGNYISTLADGVIFHNVSKVLTNQANGCTTNEGMFGNYGFNPGNPGTPNFPAIAGTQRFFLPVEPNNYFRLCSSPQNCKRYILEFDIFSSVNLTGINIGFTNNPLAQGSVIPLINSVNTNVAPGAAWQHVVLPINYCSNVACDYLVFQFPGGWNNFNYFIDNLDLHLDPNPPVFAINITTTPASGVVCSNNNAVSLTANVVNPMCAVTYNWLPGGQNTQTINDNPTVTTNYQVTVSDGCSALNANTTITVNQPQAITVSASPQTICAGQSSNLSVTPGLTGTLWFPGALPGNNVTVSPGTTTAYNVSGTDVNGCQVNGAVTVGVVNCCSAPNTLAANYSSSTIISGGLWTPSALNTVVSGGILTLQTVNVIMPINSKITVMPGCTLRVITSSNIWSCANDMWDGIEVQPGGRVEIYNKVTIEDAKIAVHLMNSLSTPADFLIYNATFNKNNKGIVVDPFNGAHPGVIYNTVFQNIPSVLTPNGSMATAPTTKNPFAGKKTAVGVEITAVNQITIGDLAGINTFSGIELGIHSTRSVLYSVKNDFSGIVYTLCGGGFCPPVCANTGICILAETKGTVNVGFNSSSAVAINHFNNSANGVITRNNVNVYVLNNKFNNMSTSFCYPSYCVGITNNLGGQTITVNKNDLNNFRTGVYINTFTKNIVNINQNNFKHHPLGLGVYCLQNSGSTLTISTNDFNSTNTNAGYTAIRLQNTTLVTNGITKVISNTIKREIIGILVTNYLNRPMVSTNDIKFYLSSAPSGNYYGIWIQGSPSTTVYNNTVSNSVIPNSSYVNTLYGIAVDASCKNSSITNNTITNMASGMRYAGVGNLPLHVSCNFMNKDFYSLEFNSTDIGDQGADPVTVPPNGIAQDNQWTYQTNPGTLGVYAVSTAQRFFYYRNSSTQWLPNINTQMFPAWPTNVVKQGIPLVGSAPYNCLYGCAIPSACKTMQIAQLARKQSPYQLQAPVDRAISIESSYREVLQDSTTYQSGYGSLDSTVIVFRDSVKQTNIGAFQEVASKSEAGDSTGARIKNISIAADQQKCSEVYRKMLNEIYLRTWAKGIFEFTPQDSAILRMIANNVVDQCGTVVYDARVMLRLDLNDYPAPVTSANRFSANTGSSATQDAVGVMYPNPAQNKAHYEITLGDKETGFVLLFDMLGNQVGGQQLNAGFNKATFDLASLSDGVYTYRVIISGEVRVNRKLVVSK